MLCAALLVAMAGFAQTDSTATDRADTIKIGNIIIIKKNRGGNRTSPGGDRVTITRKPYKPSRVKTNWWIVDVGFTNVNDKTVYGSADANSYLKTVRASDKPFTEEDLDLRSGKSSNVNLWFFMQRLNVTKGIVNLKYGLGLEMFNFRYENNISYHKNPAYIFKDSINFSKNKLYAGYLSVPFMVNFNTRPGRKEGLSFSAGVSAGYLVGSRNKQKSNERGKEKVRGDFDLEKFRVAYIGELGLGPVRLFGSYSINPMHERGLKQYPYSFGIRLSNF